MFATRDQHDQFTPQMRSRLKTAGMGLGLVRLLTDAGLTGDAMMILSSLQNGFQGMEEEAQSHVKNTAKLAGSVQFLSCRAARPSAKATRGCFDGGQLGRFSVTRTGTQLPDLT
jgi:hypothetical protein